MSVAQTIQQQLFWGGREKVWSWGAHAWKKVDESTLQFKVRGRHFSGHIRIEYNEGRDTYLVHLGRYGSKYQNRWLNIQTFEDVYCDELTNMIDEKIEYVTAYGSN